MATSGKSKIKAKPSKSKSVKKVLLKKPLKKSSKKAVAKVRKVVKKVAKKVPAKKSTRVIPKGEILVGYVIHYFSKIRVAVIKLKSEVSASDTLRIKGHTTDFSQKIESMQLDHKPIMKAKKGDEIGLLVDSRVRRRDCVTKI